MKKNKKPKKTKVSKYVVKKRNKAAYFFTSFLMTMLFLGFAYCLLTVDKNTRRVGWSEDRVELAWSSQGSTLDVTVVNNQYSFDLKPLVSVNEVLKKINQVYIVSKPPSYRLKDMLLNLIFRNINQILNG